MNDRSSKNQSIADAMRAAHQYLFGMGWNDDPEWRRAQRICSALTQAIYAMPQVETTAHLSVVRDDPVAKALTELVRLKDIKDTWESVPAITGLEDPRLPLFEVAERAYFNDYKVNVGKAWEAARAVIRASVEPTGEACTKCGVSPDTTCPIDDNPDPGLICGRSSEKATAIPTQEWLDRSQGLTALQYDEHGERLPENGSEELSPQQEKT